MLVRRGGEGAPGAAAHRRHGVPQAARRRQPHRRRLQRLPPRQGRRAEADGAVHRGARRRRAASPQEMGPLNPYERRIVHLAIAEDPGVSSESIGDAFMKTVIISSEAVGGLPAAAWRAAGAADVLARRHDRRHCHAARARRHRRRPAQRPGRARRCAARCSTHAAPLEPRHATFATLASHAGGAAPTCVDEVVATFFPRRIPTPARTSSRSARTAVPVVLARDRRARDRARARGSRSRANSRCARS